MGLIKYSNSDNPNYNSLIKKAKVYNNSSNIFNRALEPDPIIISNIIIESTLPISINNENPTIENNITLRTKSNSFIVLESFISICYFKYYLL